MQRAALLGADWSLCCAYNAWPQNQPISAVRDCRWLEHFVLRSKFRTGLLYQSVNYVILPNLSFIVNSIHFSVILNRLLVVRYLPMFTVSLQLGFPSKLRICLYQNQLPGNKMRPNPQLFIYFLNNYELITESKYYIWSIEKHVLFVNKFS